MIDVMRNLKIMISLSLLIAAGCSSPARESSKESAAAAAVNEEIGDGRVMDSDSGRALGLQSIYFDYRKDAPYETEMAKLKENARLLRVNSKWMVQLEGHCDQRGADGLNFQLGDHRARWIEKELIKLGIEKDRVSAISYGKTRLAASGTDDRSMQQNRRVNFVLLHQ